jgi:hypothetical protein
MRRTAQQFFELKEIFENLEEKKKCSKHLRTPRCVPTLRRGEERLKTVSLNSGNSALSEKLILPRRVVKWTGALLLKQKLS